MKRSAKCAATQPTWHSWKASVIARRPRWWRCRSCTEIERLVSFTVTTPNIALPSTTSPGWKSSCRRPDLLSKARRRNGNDESRMQNAKLRIGASVILSRGGGEGSQAAQIEILRYAQDDTVAFCILHFAFAGQPT